MTTRPYRDPILYPGEPIEPAVGAWIRRHHEPRTCSIGGEEITPGTPAQWTGDGWRCREHAEVQAAVAFAEARTRRDARAKVSRRRWRR